MRNISSTINLRIFTYLSLYNSFTLSHIHSSLYLTYRTLRAHINQRLILCLIVIFSKMNLYLRDIIQTYVQSVTSLNRDFFVRSFVELIKHLDIDSNSILKIMNRDMMSSKQKIINSSFITLITSISSKCLNQFTISVFFIQI